MKAAPRIARTVRIDIQNDEWLTRFGEKKADVINFAIRKYREQNGGSTAEEDGELLALKAAHEAQEKRLAEEAQKTQYLGWQVEKKIMEIQEKRKRIDEVHCKQVLAAKPDVKN